ncbi:hypothetical protein C2W58_01423 [Bacillus pumilus]|uniref:Uncharacterized protein n=1 Tax=Bacillus pumilus TaxID=1408 RepID=A0AB34R2Q9_BACPU|nr:hypothetical protein B4127_1236 [Bacillus pumilus]RAP05585.1 hypothetical protein C2W58_01423 [Bacillus pumilus]
MFSLGFWSWLNEKETAFFAVSVIKPKPLETNYSLELF